jgi:MerR family regulatory protein
MKDILTIGEVAARSGVATSALRFYEAWGRIRSERTLASRRCLSLDRFRLANPEDRVARRGAGPRYGMGHSPSSPAAPA